MSSFPAGPQLYKGAVVTVDPNTQQPSVIMFQYNPERLRRSFQPQTVGGETGNRSQAVVYTGAPVEMINADIDIDATDQLATGDDSAAQLGIYPQLSALELLLYPRTTDVNTQAQMLAGGTIEVGPFVAPLTLFVWGKNRVVPIRVIEMSVSEEAFGGYLNPIRATVSLGMRVLSFSDMATSSQGYGLYMQYQQVKENLAAVSHSLRGTGILLNQI